MKTKEKNNTITDKLIRIICNRLAQDKPSAQDIAGLGTPFTSTVNCLFCVCTGGRWTRRIQARNGSS